MPKRKKSKKRASPQLPVIMVVLPDDAEMDEAMKAIKDPKKKKVGFKIEDVGSAGSIPVVRARNHPVQL